MCTVYVNVCVGGVHIYMYIISLYVHVCTYVQVHVCMYVKVHVCSHVRVCMYSCESVYVVM